MVLTSDQIKEKAIVEGADEKGTRTTTYDATVGKIINEGSEHDGDTFILPPRGIVWVVSAETFNIPTDITGLATLKTHWTHSGVLALNVGIVDPGWHGPLSTALVNFSNSPFSISKGAPFFRLLFHEHAKVEAEKMVYPMDEYIGETKSRSRQFATSFLNMESLTKEVSENVLKLPQWALKLSVLGVLLALLAIFAPIAFTVWTDYSEQKTRLQHVEDRLKQLETREVERVLGDSD